MLAFSVSRIYFGRPDSTEGDFRLAMIHILLTAFGPAAYFYMLSVTRQVARDITPVLIDNETTRQLLDEIGKTIRWRLMLAVLFGVMVDVYATSVTTVGSDPWVWQDQNIEAKWMRILGPIFSGWLGCLFYGLVRESIRVSRLSANIKELDLLDLKPYQPLIKQGLTNVLLAVGVASTFSLFLLEPGFTTLVVQLLTPLTILAWVGLMLPLSGIRRKIKLAKQQELDWCAREIRESRNRFKSGSANGYALAELVAYQTLIEGIRNWPFENPTLVRFALYLLIPLASMFGGALVERGLDLFLG